MTGPQVKYTYSNDCNIPSSTVHLPAVYIVSGLSLKVVNNNSFFTKTNISFSRNKKKNFVQIYAEGMRVALWEKLFTFLLNFSHNKDDFSLLMVHRSTL